MRDSPYLGTKSLNPPDHARLYNSCIGLVFGSTSHTSANNFSMSMSMSMSRTTLRSDGGRAALPLHAMA